MLLTYIYCSTTLRVSYLHDISINHNLVTLITCLQYSFLGILIMHYSLLQVMWPDRTDVVPGRNSTRNGSGTISSVLHQCFT